jgi:AraC-like DNA-binding protein
MKKRLTPESLFALRSRVLAAFFSLQPLSPLTGKPFSPSVSKTLIFSYRNRGRSAKVSEASQAAGVKPRRLERRLAKEIGMGFHVWHTGERMALAKERMNLYGDTPEVAMRKAGFGNLAFSQFSHVFTAWIRMRPREFWEMCQGENSPEGRLRMQVYYEKLKEFQDLMCLVHEGKATWRQKSKAVYEEKMYRQGALVPREYSTGETWLPRGRTKK